jgi:hypothetical protein
LTDLQKPLKNQVDPHQVVDQVIAVAIVQAVVVVILEVVVVILEVVVLVVIGN